MAGIMVDLSKSETQDEQGIRRRSKRKEHTIVMAKESNKKRKTRGTLNALTPSAGLLAKLGSAIVHADEYMSSDGREVDRQEFLARLSDPEVQQWIEDMGPLLPLKRNDNPIEFS